MISFRTPHAVFILLLLLSGTLCTGSLIPFMGVYIVEILGKDPWMISLYAMLTLSLTVVVNRIYGEWIDNGRRIAPLILTSILAFGFALCAMLVFKTYAVLIFICAPCFALSNAAVSTMYSFGRLSAQQNGWDIARYNSYLRATTSLGWMIAPAVTFLIAGAFGASYVMISALVLTAVWATLWWMVMPRDFVKQSRIKDPSTDGGNLSGNAKAMWTAAGVCLLFSLAHSATTSSLPLFYIREAGLPVYAAGLSFSIKTFIEIPAILSTPLLITTLGVKRCLGVAAVIAICAFLVLANVQSLSQLVVGASLEGLYYGIFAAVGLLYIQSFAGDRLGRATSLYMNSLYIGALIASPMMGLVAQLAGFRTVILLSTVWATLALLVLIVSGRNPTRLS